MMTFGKTLMEVRGLGVELSGRTILSGVDLELRQGELVSIIGPNGAGKTTLLRAMDGLVPPTQGEVLLDSRSLNLISRRKIAQRISYVPQGDPGGLDFTVRTFVELGRYPNLGPWESLGPDDSDAVQSALETTEIAQLADRQLAFLSGGERQRVLIAAALAQGGNILLLDEPTSFLDYRHQQQILTLLDRLHRDGGYACVMITHDLNAAARMSDRILILKRGRQAMEGSVDEVFQEEKLAQIFEVPFQMLETNGKKYVLMLGDLGSE